MRKFGIMRLLRTLCTAILAAAVACPCSVAGQEYPAKPIRLIVPFPPGGGTDILARLVGQRLTESLGRTVIVDNRPGAGGNLGAELAAKASPDGYSLLMVSASYAVNATLYKLAFDPLRDLAPVTLVANVPFALVANPALPAATIKELVALAQARPGEINYASSGNGSAPHLAGELFTMMTHTRMVHVPYKGGAPALTDVLGGQVQLLVSTAVQALPFIKSGRLKALGICGRSRSAVLPAVPTIDESGVPGYDISNWFGILAPRQTPVAIVARLNREILRQLQSDDLKARFATDGAEAAGSSAADFERVIRADIDKFARIVKAAGIRIN
ncbi:MAG: tripartite tricarboxylate transporter substrate binding protein [Betaproteobacteria bacterium]|nr:tripartite tricarboxylate transporter substrate binding protein [Betaproteobacteria bacterium]